MNQGRMKLGMHCDEDSDQQRNISLIGLIEWAPSLRLSRAQAVSWMNELMMSVPLDLWDYL